MVKHWSRLFKPTSKHDIFFLAKSITKLKKAKLCLMVVSIIKNTKRNVDIGKAVYLTQLKLFF